METLQQQWDAITLIKIFEIEVIDKRTGLKEYIIFDITMNKRYLIASHVALTTAEEGRNFIAFKAIEIDDSFTLDENLQELYEVCIESITNSDFYKLNN